jgi:hypothetical protein
MLSPQFSRRLPPPAPTMSPCCPAVCECGLLIGVEAAEVVVLAFVGGLRLPPLPECTHHDSHGSSLCAGIGGAII